MSGVGRLTRMSAAMLCVTLATAFAVGSAVSPVTALGPPPAAAQTPIEAFIIDLINNILDGLEDPQPLVDTSTEWTDAALAEIGGAVGPVLDDLCEGLPGTCATQAVPHRRGLSR